MSKQIDENPGFLRAVVRNRKILFGLAKNDFKSRYASSFFGTAWAFIQPISMLLVLWFVFQVAQGSNDVDGAPFIVWFAPAFLSWNYFAESWVMVTSSLKDYSYLVRKVNFQVNVIPLVRILSNAIVHLVLIGVIFVLLLLYRIPFSVYNLQVFYYFFCMIALLVGNAWLFASIMPFATDTLSVVSILTQIGFWASPIAWNPSIVTGWAVYVLKLNPMYYICRGYRDAFINHIWFWERGYTNLYFWGFTLLMLALGIRSFKKMAPQFADVL